MQNIDKINIKLTDELAVLRQRVAELEQSEIFYQKRQTALEKQLTELKIKLPLEVENSHLKVVDWQIENETSVNLNLPTDMTVILQQLQQEIAARQQIEVVIRETEERLRLALDVSQMGLWDWNLVTNQVIWSENYQLLFGLLPSSFDSPYETFQKCVHPEDSQSVMQAIAHALTQKTDYNDEFRIVRSDQSTHWISAKGKFIYDERGQAVRMIGVCMETTVCQQAKESTRELTTQVQEQANILNAILTASVDHIYIFNRQGCYQYVSRDGATLLGLNPEDIIGKSLPEMDLPADLIMQVDRQRQAVMRSGQPIKDECKYFTADALHYYEYILTPLRNLNQTIEGVITVARDITAHKRAEKSLRESEARFRRLFESNLIGVAFWTVDGFILDANDAFLQLAGYTRDEFATLGRFNWRELTPVEYQHLDDRILLEVQTTGVSKIYEKEYIHRNGKRVPIVLGMALLNDSQEHGVAFVLDITERKLAQQECDRLLDCERTARQQAEIANKVKDEFLAVLSHELRTPLNSVLGWSKMLRTRKFDEKTTHHALETIERNAKLQTQLIEDLLDVSRILQGKLNLNTCPVSLVMVVEATLQTVQLAAQAKSIQIQTIFDANLGQVMGDPNRLQQVVWNLLSNAVKFTPTGGRVEIRLMEAGNQAQIQVSDTGKGISLDFLPYVFDYFRQADGTTTRTFGGLGLGLAIVRRVVEMHGGNVQAESLGEGLGASFTVELPLLVRSEQVRGEENQSSYSEPVSSLLADTQVLVVDDEPDIRDLLTFILQDYGVQVTAVSSAQEALHALAESIPDVLISDIGMPKTDGYMLMREVRSRSPGQGGNVPAIALTAYAGEMNQQQALAAGFQMHISKPIDPDVLVQAIADLIQPS
ncbi:PAS domain-containing hybrid sensor histidine kinase/response regulator [Nostoc sp. 'Lobaria pulmonaria (5183) cyanobiont']|uniref:PAS domain-containing hybrid sensor histidine kinase/response regulator n=1 Tax=Nostoc sp. 'Lobaria pulmonaria (5183) cyanobiont' TaxID=1618022 RepID=UPI000CF35235|nr:PAS domain S-box protein [Nostoc sp. 'Lobaria pulmonaria (5183) cyanobiont']AVH74079.1 histidine kinase [Nostoc sp. 'Lobaria pulmonaria (5183) cyanobiont']